MSDKRCGEHAKEEFEMDATLKPRNDAFVFNGTKKEFVEKSRKHQPTNERVGLLKKYAKKYGSGK